MHALLRDVRNIHAVGRNYVAHTRELGNAQPAQPVLFSKSPATLAHGDAVHLPAAVGTVHHELELVLRIGVDLPVGAFRDLSCISHVGLGIDFTARDRQTALKNAGLPWHLAKNFRDGCYLLGLTAGADPAAPRTFTLDVNGTRRQSGDSSLMVFSPAHVLAFLNATHPLAAGDLLFTGTPEGVGPVAHGDTLHLACPDLGLEGRVAVTVS